MTMIKIALIGNGGMCKAAHVPAYRDDPRTEVVAVCDIIEERAVYLKETWFPEAAVYTDYRELLKDPAIDAVDICTPNDMHSEIAVAALEAGKHVFCEKPDAVDVGKAQAMKDAAEKSGKLLMVMRNNRFTSASRYLKSFIEDGRAGEIYCGRCGWQRRRGIPGKGGWFTTKAKSGGGPLIDLGVHMIDLAVWLMGNPKPVAVSANTYCKFAENDVSDSVNSDFGDKNAAGTFDVEDLAMGMIRFDNGAVLQIEFSWASNIKQERRFVELRGTAAGIKWEDEQAEIYTEENGRLLDTTVLRAREDDGHRNNLRQFIDILSGGGEPCYTPQQGVDMIRILRAVYESAETGREVLL
ncbi:MAG: Gfo/Idh/MocA family oxidoreductase [Clostridia bacterium]|nr:Gfo/Idh/MocA family oxidoreductase [Clostridia bacterium]